MTPIEEINDLLIRSETLLNEAATKIRDSNFNREQNVKRIGDALTRIFEVRLEIFNQHPHLKPDYL